MSRFWELLCGALLAYRFAAAAHRGTGEGLPGEFGLAVSLLGIGLLLAGFLLIGPDAAFPGWWALLPALGTVCLLAVPASWLNRSVLSARPLVYVGLISYPLYLWHWVILTFARIAHDGEEIPRSWRLLAIAASFLLAWLTYVWVEKPIRFGADRNSIPRTLVGLMAACAAAAVFICVTDGAAFRYPEEVRTLAAFNYDHERDYNEQAYRSEACFLSAKQTFADLEPRCIEQSDPRLPLVVVWGDSHAASLYPGLVANQERGRYRIAQFTASGCPPMIELRSEQRRNCKSFNVDVMAKLAALKPAAVIIEAHWALYAGINGLPTFEPAALRATVLKMQQIGVRKIIVMGGLPTWTLYQPRVSFEVWREEHTLRDRTAKFLDPAPAAADLRVRAALAGTAAVFVSAIDLLCDTAGCLLSADPQHAVPVAWDNDHLTVAGSALLVRRAFTSALSRLEP